MPKLVIFHLVHFEEFCLKIYVNNRNHGNLGSKEIIEQTLKPGTTRPLFLFKILMVSTT